MAGMAAQELRRIIFWVPLFGTLVGCAPLPEFENVSDGSDASYVDFKPFDEVSKADPSTVPDEAEAWAARIDALRARAARLRNLPPNVSLRTRIRER